MDTRMLAPPRGPASADARPAETTASARLRALRTELQGETVSLGDLLDALGAGATGLVLVLLGAASLVPGVAPVFGVALCVVALDLCISGRALRLPAWLRRRRIARGRLASGIDRLAPRLEWLERRMRPRRPALLRGAGLRLVGLAAAIDGVLVVLPVPLGNTVPAVAVLLLALGLTTADGLAVLGGLVATLFALAVDGGLVFLGYAAIARLFGIFG